MPRRLVLFGTCFIALNESALAHDVGFAEHVLQPLTALHSLLALLAVGLLNGQQRKPLRERDIAAMLGLGLTLGLVTTVFVTRLQDQPSFPLALAALAGGLAALALPLPAPANSLLVLALGAALGANLSSETTDWVDRAQTLVGAFVGSGATLLGLGALANQPAKEWWQIGVRVVGSWIFASAIMVLVLNAHGRL